MCNPLTDERDDERTGGAEHPDLVLNGEEEHPLRWWLPELVFDDDPVE